MLNVSIYRYNPEVDSEPYMQDFKVDTQGKDLWFWMCLRKLKTEDPTLVFRRSCREGVCGSDGMNISGKNGLACITPLSEAVKKQQAGDSPAARSAGDSRSGDRYEPVLRPV